ncbi:FtsB family cell division protein [Arthrobacter oryzae]|uniref:Cell division protein FtsB n=1 Tax=Arthrobacter oryzae TaxID=409290 RepID=A0A495ES05_9MICC|nr:septum formation initiator family protein [Arthrobacter oryzae]RKR19411.1 cell division protein FtsB [Arthrobacter oryzae]
MATRRPNVPRATPATPKTEAARPAAGGLGGAADGGDVIQADFGGARAGAAAPTPADTLRGTSGSASGGAPAAHNAAPNSAASGTVPAAGKPTEKPAGNNTGKPAAKPGGNARRAAAPGDSDESLDPVPAKAFSGRLLALGVVMIAITILLAPTVKIFLDKRAEIAALQADLTAKQAKQEDLKRQVSRWQDPNYVKQQARDRINMVMPGETGYWVFGGDLPAAQSGGAAGAASAQNPANLPWVDSLWESIRRSATD